jgi:tetratricopeptide (TPR) repeat protein
MKKSAYTIIALVMITNLTFAMDVSHEIGKEQEVVAKTYFNQGINCLTEGLVAQKKDLSKSKEWFAKAIVEFSESIRLNPNDPKFTDAYFGRGLTYKTVKDYNKAIENYTSVIKITPNDADAYFSRGRCYFAMNLNKEAIDDFSESIRLNPKFGEAYMRRAVAYGKLENSIEADNDANIACLKFQVCEARRILNHHKLLGAPLALLPEFL